MTTGHDFQQLQNAKGGVMTACRFCLCAPSDPKAKEPCAANVLANMPPVGEPKTAQTVVSSAPVVAPMKLAGSAVDLVKSLDADAIQAKITELSGEIAGLEVLLKVAKARDAKAKKESTT